MTAEDLMREERERTLTAITKLPLPTQVRDDALRTCAALQSVNDMIVDLDHAIDRRVTPTAMRLMADEIERLNRRFVEAGLAARSQ